MKTRTAPDKLFAVIASEILTTALPVLAGDTAGVLPAKVSIAAFVRERILNVADAALNKEPVVIAKISPALSDGVPDDFYSQRRLLAAYLKKTNGLSSAGIAPIFHGCFFCPCGAIKNSGNRLPRSKMNELWGVMPKMWLACQLHTEMHGLF